MRIIGGEARGRKIEAPSGTHTRPTLDRVRENIFNMIQGYVEDAAVLDLFAGSGALSLEAVSRGAQSAVMVDSDRNACMVQKRNIDTLRYNDHVKQYRADWKTALGMIRQENIVFDLVFLDPPYAITDLRDVFSALVPVVAPEALIILEHETGVQPAIPDCFRAVKHKNYGFCSVSLYQISDEGA